MRIYVQPIAEAQSPTAIPDFIRAIPQLVRAWIARQRRILKVTTELNRYSDHGLADLGLSRSDIYAVARGQVWRD